QQTGLSPLYRLYETKEGWLCLACLTGVHWEGLGRAIPGLADDDRFATVDRRETNSAALAGVLEATFRERTAAQWFATLDAAGVPCEISSETYSRDIFFDPEALQAQLIVEYAHPEFGALRQSGHHINFAGLHGRIFRAPPLVGEHTRAILADLGYVAEEIDRLREKSVITWP